jgi:SAM-dependent methyltransferase
VKRFLDEIMLQWPWFTHLRTHRRIEDMKMVPMDRCEICQGNNLSPLRIGGGGIVSNRSTTPRKRDYHAASSEKLTHRLVKCLQCDLVQVSPLPNEDLIVESYMETDASLHSKQDRNRIRSFSVAVSKLKKFPTPPRALTILDIGCASGEFLRAMKMQGHEVYGIEPSRVLSQIARVTHGLDVLTGTFDTVTPQRPSFDVVSMWDVLEHLNSPTKMLEAVKDFVNQDGYLILNLPMIDTFPARIMGRFWPFYLDVHFYYFTLKTIRNALEKSGFEMIETRRYWQTLSIDYLLERQFGLTGLKTPNIRLRYYLGQRTLLCKVKK